jgi:hypothetical protein
MPPDVSNYAIAFLLALIIEPAVAWALGYRRGRELACVAAVNVFSHPAANFLVSTIVRWRERPFGFEEMLLLEIGVVLVEWRLMCYALPERSRRGLFCLSLVMNSVSYVAGYFVPWA